MLRLPIDPFASGNALIGWIGLRKFVRDFRKQVFFIFVRPFEFDVDARQLITRMSDAGAARLSLHTVRTLRS
jgi:hypothetical protein